MHKLAWLVVLGAWLSPSAASACSCVALTAEAAFGSHAAVFEGRVLEVQPAADPSESLVAVMEVVQHWKGVATERVEVSTAAQSSMCGTSFEVGTSWLVYADGQGAALTTGLCDRTRRIEDAAEDLAFLGAGVVPVEVTEEDEVEAPAVDEPPARGGCASCATAPAGNPLGLGWLALAYLVARRRVVKRTIPGR